MTTSKGRKRKLSCYRSKHKNPPTGKKFIKPNYVKVNYDSSDSDDELDVERSSGEDIHEPDKCDSSSSQNDGIDTGINDQSESSNSSDNEPGGKFKDNCLRELKESNLLNNLVEKLAEHGHLYDFMNLLHNLESGKFEMDNIVFLLLMERVRFQNLDNTVAMRYGRKTKLFWTIVYRLCKGTGLKFFSGSKNWGQVVNKTSEKNRYSPDIACINFAVPDEKVLRDYRHELPKIIPPGKIHQSLELL